MTRIFLCGVAALVLTVIGASGQEPLTKVPPPPWINGGGEPPLKQAEVLSDHRITFRIKAPKATEVSVSVGAEHADLHTYPMMMGEDGIWSVTIPRVTTPEIYPYRFNLAGAVVQPGTVEVKGDAPAYYDVQDVPHGSYAIQDYFSKAWNKQRVLGVYLPAEYFSEPTRRFPVLYYYDNPVGFIGGMQYRTVLDNLIAQKKAVPFIFVQMTEDASSGTDAEGDRMKNSREFATEIIPLVDSRYRTIADRNHRAVGGISHNAGATWTTSITNLDKISWMGMLSSGMFGGLLPRTTGPHPFALYAPWEPEKVLPDATKAMKDPAHPLKLLYIADGDIDPRMPPTKIAVEQFKAHGVTPIFEVYPGGHQAKAFRPSFASFISKLFK